MLCLLAGALAQPPPRGCSDSLTRRLPFCDVALSPAARASDLVSRLTLAEKLSLTDSSHAALDRLRVPAYTFGNECLHGAVVSGTDSGVGAVAGATVFPQPIAWGASFDAGLVAEIGAAVSTEARALNNQGVKRGGSMPGFLSCFAPNLNIFRDPRWGRGSETYGEDPLLTSNLTAAFVSGLQGSSRDAHRAIKVAATCKHFAAYSFEEAGDQMRFWFDARVSAQDLTETYLPAFSRRAFAKERAASVSGRVSIPRHAGERTSSSLAPARLLCVTHR